MRGTGAYHVPEVAISTSPLWLRKTAQLPVNGVGVAVVTPSGGGCQILPRTCGLPKWQARVYRQVFPPPPPMCALAVYAKQLYIKHKVEKRHHFLFMHLIVGQTNINRLGEVTQTAKVRQKSPAGLDWARKRGKPLCFFMLRAGCQGEEEIHHPEKKKKTLQ